MFLSGITDWISELYAAVELKATDAIQWVGDTATAKYNQWKADAAAFRKALADLQATPGTDATSTATRNSLLARGADISSKVTWVEQQLKTITDYVGMSGLGVVPLLIPAVVVAAIAAVTLLIYKWTNEVSAYLKEQRLVASGMPRDQAQAQTKDSGLFGDAAKLIWPVALGAIALALIKGKR